MAEAILRAEALKRTLPGEVAVTLVDGISLAIGASEFVAITGPSGSGKSSLLYLLGLLDAPTSGRLWLKDTETTRLGEDALAALRLADLGFVFQSNFLLPEFTALENVMLPMQRLGRRDAQACRQHGEDILDSLGLADQRGKLPRQMSGGQNQRVAIARALANDPVLILADEPTGNLDTKSSANVQHIMKNLARGQGRAVVVVTHDPQFAAQADRIVVVVDGRLANVA